MVCSHVEVAAALNAGLSGLTCQHLCSTATILHCERQMGHQDHQRYNLINASFDSRFLYSKVLIKSELCVCSMSYRDYVQTWVC